MDVRKRIVQAGYDALGERHLAWSEAVQGDPRDRFLRELMGRLHGGGRVLDLGCGAGVPSTKQLAERFEVVGVDISDEQIHLARANVPTATFVRSDLSELRFEEDTFDGVTAFYSISHVPRQEHAALFEKIARWLKPNGLFLAALGARGGADWTGQWLGVPMFFSSHDANTNLRLLQAAGLTLVLDEVVPMKEPEGVASFLWVLAVKSQRSDRPAPEQLH